MKKLLAFTLALCMIFALAACGTGTSKTESGPFKPNGPVTMIVAYKAGNGTDITARILAKYAEKYIGQTIVIDNQDGGSGSKGWSKLASSKPDGMTIGFINLPNFNSSIVKKLGTYTIDSFAPICNHVTETSIVVVRADDDRFPDLNALVEYGKAHDGELIASTNGAQASNHIGAQAFANSAGFKYKAVPKGNTNEELTSLLGKEADFCVVKLPDISSMADSVKVLAVFGADRLPELPDVPTLSERGFYKDWRGASRCIAAPAGVSDEVVKFYEEAFKKAMEDPDYLAESSSFATDYKDAAATTELVKQQQNFTEGLATGFWYE